MERTRSPTSIRTENGQLALHIFVDMHDRDLGGYVQWSRQFEYLERATAKLKIVVPVTLIIIFLLHYLNFGRLTETLIVMLSLPFALVGGLWLRWWLGLNMSVAVVVGFITLAVVAAETGVVMLMYLDQALKEIRHEREAASRAFTRVDLCGQPFSPNTVHLTIRMVFLMLVLGGSLSVRRRIGKELIFRLTPRLLRRWRRTGRSS